MLSRISDHFHTWAKGWIILSIIAAFVLLVNLPLADPALISMSLDGQFAYTPEQAFSAVASYGDDGRVQMIWIHLADFILITLYTSMFCLSISWLFQRGFQPGVVSGFVSATTCGFGGFDGSDAARLKHVVSHQKRDSPGFNLDFIQ